MDPIKLKDSLQEARMLLCRGMFEGSGTVDAILSNAREHLAVQIDEIVQEILREGEKQEAAKTQQV